MKNQSAEYYDRLSRIDAARRAKGKAGLADNFNPAIDYMMLDAADHRRKAAAACLICSQSNYRLDDSGVCSACRPASGPGADDSTWTPAVVAEMLGEEMIAAESIRSLRSMFDAGFIRNGDEDGFLVTMMNGQQFLVRVSERFR